MRTLSVALEAFRQDLGQCLQADANVRAVDCEAGLAEDGVSIVVIAALTNGAHICAGFDLPAGEHFDADAREFLEAAYALLAETTCEFFVADAGAQ